MNQFLVFNHHSLPFDSKESASSTVPEFLKICVKANNLGLSTILIDESVDTRWFRLQLSEGYFWQDWYKQNNNDQQKDLIRAFKNICTQQPFFSSDDIGEGLDLFEVKLNGDDKFSALKAAVWHESPMTSFPTRNPWSTSPITVNVNKIEKDANLVSTNSEIINLFSVSVLEHLKPELLEIRSASIQSGKELLKRKDEIFPFIEFCGKSEQQLSNWSSSKTILEQVKESISALNVFCEKWTNGEFEDYSHENLKTSGLNHMVSGESQTVLQNQKLRCEREFYLPNGRRELFEKHIKIAKGYRIHFFPDAKSKKISIGHIGAHLKSK